MARWLKALAAVLLLAAAATARKPAAKHEPQIEEVTAKQLERVLEDKDFVAVFWCKCGVVLTRLPPAGPRASPLILRAVENWPSARAGATAVSKRLRRRPSKWVIVELMIFGRAERKAQAAAEPRSRMIFSSSSFRNSTIMQPGPETIKLDPAADRCGAA